jgi:hypothetical protein
VTESGQNHFGEHGPLGVNVIYNQDLLNGIERSALAAMNSKAQAYFVNFLNNHFKDS